MNSSIKNTNRSRPLAIPSNGNSNGNGRRRRNRRRARGPNTAILPGGVRITDTEILSQSEKLFVLEFCPGRTGLPRLDNEANKFTRWSLIRVVLTYQPTASLSDSGSFSYGILPGPKNDTLTEKDITKLRPFQKHSLWKSSSLTVSNNIVVQRHLFTAAPAETTRLEDSVGFCVYIFTSKKDLGTFRVNYSLVLNYPKP